MLDFCSYFSSVLPHFDIFDFVSCRVNRLIELWIFILLLFKFLQIYVIPVSVVRSTIEVCNEIASGTIVKPIVCVHFFSTNLTKSGVELMEFNFKIRMGEVEGVLMTNNFEFARQRSTTIMKP
ncbi:hypothetical protein ACJW30_03G037900 [Castanea mollissima]